MSDPSHTEVMVALTSLKHFADAAAPHLATLRAYQHKGGSASQLVANLDYGFSFLDDAMRYEESNTPAARRSLELLRLKDRSPRLLLEIQQTEADLLRARNPEKRASLEARLTRLKAAHDSNAQRMHDLETTP